MAIINRRMLEDFSNDELQKVISMAEDIARARKNLRQKELWGNVMAALRKYEKECGEILVSDGNDDGTLLVDELDTPGVLPVDY